MDRWNYAPSCLELTMLGQAGGGVAFSSRKGSTAFGFPHTGYPLILP